MVENQNRGLSCTCIRPRVHTHWSLADYETAGQCCMLKMKRVKIGDLTAGVGVKYLDR
jgi:hypothetical protein